MSKIKEFQLAPIAEGKSLKVLEDPFLSHFNMCIFGMPRAGKSEFIMQFFMKEPSPYVEHFNQILYVTRNTEDMHLKRQIESYIGENGYLGCDTETNLTEEAFRERLLPSSVGKALVLFDDYLTSGRKRQLQADFVEHLAKTRAHILGEDSNTSVVILGHNRTALPPGLIESMNQVIVFKGGWKTFKEATDLYMGLKPRMMDLMYKTEFNEPYSFLMMEIGGGGVARIFKGLCNGDTGVLKLEDVSDKYMNK